MTCAGDIFKAPAAICDGLLRMVYPDRCLLCGLLGEGSICPGCLLALVTPLPKPTCELCGHPSIDSYCGRCRDARPAFDSARAVGLYAGPLRDAIQQLKFHDKPMLAWPLGLLMAKHMRSIPHRFGELAIDAIVPVPMTVRRKYQRGYNQAERLAKAIARELNVPLDRSSLHRRARSRPQVGLGHAEREANLAGKFAARKEIAGKRVVLVDDVSTTGATLRECADALKTAGAAAVYCITLAAG